MGSVTRTRKRQKLMVELLERKGRLRARQLQDGRGQAGVGDFGPTNPDLDVGMFNDVWVLANANGSGGTASWTQLHPMFAGDGFMLPGARTWFSTVRDPNTNSMIIFVGVAFEAAYGSPWVLSQANGL